MNLLYWHATTSSTFRRTEDESVSPVPRSVQTEIIDEGNFLYVI